MRTLLRSIFLLAPVLAVAMPGIARATPGFPSGIQTDLSLTYAPDCTICHTTDSGGTGTITRAFGKSMQVPGGLLPNDDSSLKTALDTLTTDKTDSDGDCVPDIQQLKDGRDPNTGAYIDGSGKPTPTNTMMCASTSSSSSGSVDPAFGCGAQLAAGPLPDSALPAAAALATLLGLAFTRRRRRR